MSDKISVQIPVSKKLPTHILPDNALYEEMIENYPGNIRDYLNFDVELPGPRAGGRWKFVFHQEEYFWLFVLDDDEQVPSFNVPL